MQLALNAEQKERQAGFRAFVGEAVVPRANAWDEEEQIPREAVELLAREGYLGAVVPKERGGLGMDALTYGLLHEAIGYGCSSLRSILTVHCMVAYAILRWGTEQQKARWLPKMAAGEVLAAFALTEQNVGSDAKRVETKAVLSGETWILNGGKRWITAGQIADLFLVLAQCDGSPTAFLVEKSSAGFSCRPMRGLLGMRAAMLAELDLRDCHIPKGHLVGRAGFGFSHVAGSALHDGRYSVAWGCVGLAQACVDASVCYASERQQFGARLCEHQLVQRMITDMIVALHASRLLCCQAAYHRQTNDPRSIIDAAMAKYFASTAATRIASDAVQIHGANGCGSQYPVQRYLRDAKIMEIIEGSTQIQQILIAKHAFQNPIRPAAGGNGPGATFPSRRCNDVKSA